MWEGLFVCPRNLRENVCLDQKFFKNTCMYARASYFRRYVRLCLLFLKKCMTALAILEEMYGRSINQSKDSTQVM